MTSDSARAAVRLGILRFPARGQVFPGRNGAPGMRVIVDVRGALANLALRDLICAELERVLDERFPQGEAFAGIAKAGTAWAAILADRRRLPFAAINLDGPRASGLRRQVEGDIAGRATLLVDNLIAGGGSMARASMVVTAAGALVRGALTIVADPGAPLAFPVHSLWRQAELVDAALELGEIDAATHHAITEKEH